MLMQDQGSLRKAVLSVDIQAYHVRKVWLVEAA